MDGHCVLTWPFFWCLDVERVGRKKEGREGASDISFSFKVIEALSPNAVMLRVTASAYEFWGHIIQSMAAL